jgi:hypothetical protein
MKDVAVELLSELGFESHGVVVVVAVENDEVPARTKKGQIFFFGGGRGRML